MLAATGGMLIVSLAAPGAFGRDALIFGVAYSIVRAIHLGLLVVAARGDEGLLHTAH